MIEQEHLESLSVDTLLLFTDVSGKASKQLKDPVVDARNAVVNPNSFTSDSGKQLDKLSQDNRNVLAKINCYIKEYY